ncbi:MAG: ABC transporter ATP-binding protein [Psychroflexus sp.]|uniref:ABC transporter ATP-binding protein n=1 Tax=Psychroflexus sp. S27 TaxID=1982757 RepID=UPI000C2A4D86|nr:ABC transporter ATP-binding protein [Psychroflexus sp. S27]PJX22705.1 sulfate ABC transporter ATP-binding protein [Psychroflexus sp. S27]
MRLELKNIAKSFQHKSVLSSVNLQLNENQVISILGKSGSGKTSLLKIIAGLEKPDSGDVLLNRKSILNQQINQRQIVYLFQEALLFPHLNVFDNIAFGLLAQKVDTTEIEHRVKAILKEIALSDHSSKLPHQLSGGEKQRVAFARAIIIKPQALLLDEPFGALDVETRENMQKLFLKLIKQYGISALFVTHDLKEALMIGDQIAKIEKGYLKTYTSKKDFIQDESSGVKEEIDFWTTIQKFE